MKKNKKCVECKHIDSYGTCQNSKAPYFKFYVKTYLKCIYHFEPKEKKKDETTN